MNRDRTVLLLALILLVAGGIWLAFGSTETPVPNADEATDRPAADAGASRPGIQRDASTAPVTPMREAATSEPADKPTPTGPDTTTLRGRCIDSASREPLPDVAVTLRIARGLEGIGNGNGNEEVEFPDGPPLTAITTDLDGVFEFTESFDAWQDALVMRVEAKGFVTRTGRWSRPVSGEPIDVGDIPMQRAIAVRGTIVDQQDAPVAGVHMMFVYIELKGGHELEAEHFLRATSDAEGLYEFPAPAFPGEWYIGAEGTGALVAPRSVKLGPELTEYELRVIVERADPQFDIQGTVVDWQNRPLADARLSVSGEGFIGRGRSGPDGRFTIRRAGPIPDDGKPGTRLSCSLPDGLHHRVSPPRDERIPWGAEGIEVVMRRLTQHSVRVVDGNGTPVESYALFVFRGKQRRQVYRSLLRRGRHIDGRCALDGLHAGSHVLLVAPRDQRFATTSLVPFEIDLDAPPSETTVELQSPVQTTVHVATAAGIALADSKVELLLDLGAASATPSSKAVPLTDADRSRLTPDHLVMVEATTDADGKARLEAPPGQWTLRATSDRHLPVVQPLTVRAPSTAAHLTVEAAATIHGQLTPPVALAALRELGKGGKEPLAVIVTPENGEARPPALVDSEGRFAVGGLSAGPHAVAVRHWLRSSEVQARSVTQSATDVELLPGGAREVMIDVTGMLPGTVHGRVIAGGEPLRDVHCFLRRRGLGLSRGARVGTDANGRYEGLVPPGNYGFSITYPAQPGPGWVVMVLADEWTLQPGETREQNFDVPLRRVRVRILDEADAPVEGLQVKVIRKGYFLPGGLTTDATGRVEIFPAPLAAFHLRTEIAGQRVELGPVDLPTGIATGEVTLQLPQ